MLIKKNEVFWGRTIRELLTFLKEKDIPVGATIEGSDAACALFIDWEEEVPKTKEENIAFRKAWDARVVPSEGGEDR